MKFQAKRLFPAFLLALVLGAVTVAAALASSAPAPRMSADDVAGAEFDLGETLEIPELSIDGVKAAATVIFPDGSASGSGRVKLTVHGLYTIVYGATVEGRYRERRVQFSVRPAAYTVTGEGASAVWGTNSYDDTPALQISLPAGGRFMFNRAVDLTGLSSADDLLELYLAPIGVGSAEAEDLYIRLTDASDSEKYVTVHFWRYTQDGGDTSYGRVSVGDSAEVGMDGNMATLYEGSWGRFNLVSFSGKTNANGPFENRVLHLRYDTARRGVYLQNFIVDNDNWNLIADLDDPKFFDEPWEGFTGNRAYVSIWSDRYLSSSVNFALRKIRGYDLADVKYSDGDAPILTVDAPAEIPTASVGAAYPVFAASAADAVDGAAEVHSAVYYGYGSSARVTMPIENGRFTPDRAGTYTVVYSAADRSGNVAERTIEVTAEDTSARTPLTVSVGADPAAPEGGYMAGKPVSVAEASGGGGKPEYGRIAVFVTARLGGEEAEVKDGSFLPLRAGDWEVTYRAEALNGVFAEEKRTVTVLPNPDPVFLEEAAVPEFFVSGGTYELPDLYALDLATGERVRASISYFDTETRAADGNAVSPVLADTGVVTVTYAAGGAKKEYPVPTVVLETNGRIDEGRLIRAEGGTSAATSSGIAMNTSSEDNSFDYVNAVSVVSGAVSVAVNAEKNAFTALAVYMVDAADPENVLKFLLVKGTATDSSETNWLRVNNGQKNYAYNGSMFGKSSAPFEIGYSELNGYSVTDGQNTVKISKNLAGKKFEGFRDDLVYLSFAFEGVTGECEARLVRVGAQNFRDLGADYVAPSVTIDGSYGGAYSLGAAATIPAARATDAIDCSPRVTVSVTMPGGGYATSTEGVTLNEADASRAHEVRLDKFGTYTVVYTGVDRSGNRDMSQSFILIVVDSVAPTIEIGGKMPASGKAGKEITLPKAAAKDDQAGDLRLTVSVLAPNGRSYCVSVAEDATAGKFSKTKFLCGRPGTYVVTYVARDAAGNATVQSYEIEVK